MNDIGLVKSFVSVIFIGQSINTVLTGRIIKIYMGLASQILCENILMSNRVTENYS
jgi:hypothetical protein